MKRREWFWFRNDPRPWKREEDYPSVPRWVMWGLAAWLVAAVIYGYVSGEGWRG